MASMPAAAPQEPQLPPFRHEPHPYTGPSKADVLAMRKQHLSPGAAGPHLLVSCLAV